MKESWLYYDYLRRWWRLLLLGLILGALAGGYYFQQHHAEAFNVTATVFVRAPEQALEFRVVSNGHATKEAAVERIETIAAGLDAATNATIKIRDISIEVRTGSVWWKTTVFGSVIGGLLVIGGVYVWEDARAYQRRRQQTGPTHS